MPAEAPESASSPYPRQPKVLAVDDQPMQIQIVHRVLAPECQVLMATDGQTALRLCREKHPDLVVLDLHMPGMDGMEVLAAMRADPEIHDIPVIFITSTDDAGIESDCLQAGAADFINKPIKPRVLSARVRTHLLLRFQNERLNEMAYRDGLTGAYNRRYFDDHLRAEWQRSKRNGKPLSVILLDVDHFKAYNDHYGHQAGDQVLVSLVSALKGFAKRAPDVLARYGGEEFICLLPETEYDKALEISGNMLAKIRELAIPHEHSSAAPIVTVSAGVATMTPNLEDRPEAVVKIADERLYQAKQAGRNRAC